MGDTSFGPSKDPLTIAYPAPQPEGAAPQQPMIGVGPMVPQEPDKGLQAAQQAAELSRKERQQRQRQEQAGIFKTAVLSSAKDAAERAQLARDLESPFAITDTDIARQEKAARDLAELRRSNPELQGFLSHLPTVRMLHDDVGNLKLTSGAFDWWKRNYEVGSTVNEAGFLKAKQAFARMGGGDLSPVEKDRLAEIDRIQKMSEFENGFFDNAMQFVGQQVEPTIASVAVGAAAAGAASIGGPISAGAAYGWGALATRFTYSAVIEFGHEYESIYQQLIDGGVDPKQAHESAAKAAGAYALGAAAVETYGLHKLGKPFANAGKKIGARLLSLSEQGLTKPTIARAGGEFIKETLEGGLSEVGEEGVQELMGSAAENIASAYNKVDTTKLTADQQKAPTLGEALQRAGEVMLKTAKGMAVIAPLGPGLHYIADAERVKKAKGAQELFKQVAENSSDSQVRERSPELYAAIVDAKAKGTDTENVYIEGPKLAQALEATGQSREQLARDLPDVAKQLAESERTGEDIKIPMGDFAAKIAPTDLYPAIEKSIRIGKDGFSIDRAEEWMAEREKNREASAKLVAEASSKVADWDAQATATQERFGQQLAAAYPGMAPEQVQQVSLLYRQSVEVEAAEDGKTPAQVDAENQVKIAGPNEPATIAQTLAQFAGQKEQTADLSSLEKAKQMMAQDVDLEQIRQSTGWFLGEDGEWRFEFSDEAAKLKMLPAENAGALDLKDVLDHPKLFAAYPDLAYMRISRFKQTAMATHKGAFNPHALNIELNASMTDEETLSVLMHELQHAIQMKEGFARGGSPFEFTPDELLRLSIEKATRDRGRLVREDPQVVERRDRMLSELNAARDDYAKVYDTIVADKNITHDQKVRALEDGLEKVRKLSRAFQEDENVQRLQDVDAALKSDSVFDVPTRARVAALEAYMRLGGEVEARNTQSRLPLSEEGRKMVAPEQTADVRSEDLILRTREFQPFHDEDITNDTGAARGNEAAQRAVQDQGGVGGGSRQVDEQARAQPDAPRLVGLPATVTVDGKEVAFGPNAEARAAAARYMRRVGLPYNPVRTYAPVDVGRAKRIASAYIEMQHAPNDPQVKAAYEALARETIAQYEAMLEAGIVVQFNPAEGDPYGQPRFALLDLQDHNHLYVFSTEDGYGQVGITDKERAENPMLRDSGHKFGDRPALINDLFRAVHDYFGHFKEGVGFRARGEENAWQQHMGMYSPLARKAATTETRGQNSWVNFGPHAEKNKGASGADTVYAEQKVGLLPDWVMTEGYLGQEQAAASPAGARVTEMSAAVRNLIKNLTPDSARRLKQESEARGEFDPETNTIFLNKEANATTILHELSHFWLIRLFQRASAPTATESVKARADAVLKWFGVKNLAEWNSMSLAQQEKHHEKWAYTAEAHFFGEGQAPSANPEQRRAFRSFGRWVRAVYRNVRDVLNAKYRRLYGEDLPALTPDVRAVFDRMVASEDAIESAKTERAMYPLFREKPSGMTDEDWNELRTATDEATEAAVDELQRSSLRAMRWTENNSSRMAKQIQQVTRGLRTKVEQEERAKLEQEPVYRAQQQLRHGVTTDDEGNTRPFKVRLQDVKALGWVGDVTSEEAIAKLGTGVSGMLSENGVPLDMAASMFGFSSGAEMLQRLVQAPPLEAVVQQNTNTRMLAEHSDLTDPAKVKLLIEKALHNEARSRMVAAELKYLSKTTAPIRLMVRAAREFARDMIGKSRVGDVRPHEHAASERRYRRDAERAVMKGETEQAAALKRRELLEGQKEREAIVVRERIDDTLKLVKKLFRADKKLAATRNIDYVAVARYLAAAFGLAPGERTPESYIEQLKTYNPQMFEKLQPQVELAQQWAQDALAEGRTVKTWRDLTVDEFSDLSESIAALWNQSIREQQVVVQGKKVELNSVASELVAQDSKLGPVAELPKGARTAVEELTGGFNSMKRLVARPEHWAFRRDGAQEGKVGAFTRYFWRPIRDAVNRYVIDRNRYTKRIEKLVRDLRSKLKNGQIEFRDTNGNLLYVFGRGNGGFGHAELVGALLHTGNAGNLERLLVGRGWGTFDAVTEHLDTNNWDLFVREMIAKGFINKEVMDFVQRVWDLNDEVKPLAQRAHRDLFGFYFKEVEPVPLKMPWGDYRGGYMPAKLDKTAMSAARIQSLQDLESDFRKQFALTGRGFTQNRAAHFAEPLLLDINMVPAHIDDVLRFSHLQPAVRDVERIMNHKDVATVLDGRQPNVRQNMLLPWLQRVASQSITRAGKSAQWDNVWRFIRSSAGLSTMFANLGNALQQFTGVFQAALKVHPRYLAKGLWRLLSEGRGLYKDIAELSPGFMANRQNNQVFDSLETIRDLMTNRSKFAKTRAWVKQHGYFLQSSFQNMVDSVVWAGAFQQALDESGKTVSDADAKMEAVQRADAAVRMTQSSFDPTDVAHYEEGTPFYRIWTMFSGYFNTMANLQADQLVRMGQAQGWGKLGIGFQAYLLGFAVPMLLAEAVTRTVRGRWDDDDKDGDLDILTLDYLFMSQLRSLIAEVPVVGPAGLAPMLNMLDNQPWNDRMTTSPAVTVIEKAFGGTADAVKTALGLKQDRKGGVKSVDGDHIRDVLTLLGVISGLPLSALGSRAGYVYDVTQGNLTPDGAYDVGRSIVSGAAGARATRER